ncbi:hypothetical protein VTN77DRAFT_6173 [Rasamsonia byssochlamydoides]|uniref:uncharacterized protein n=1 Tax=Rasamsonia byssochlamydoides TaxID=89139 RepID=UPI0037437BDD
MKNNNTTSSSSTGSRVCSPLPASDDRGHRLAAAYGGLYFFRSLVWDLFESGQYSDLTIRVKGSAAASAATAPREFRVHRAVVCPQSKIFETACRGEFMEASTNTITLNDYDPEIVEHMVKYLYTHGYDDDEDWDCYQDNPAAERTTTAVDGIQRCEPKQEEVEHELQDSWIHVSSSSSHGYGNASVPNSLRVYAIADKYLILPLKELARARFTKWAAYHWSSPRFLAAAREIFDGETGNYSELREAVMMPLVRHADCFLDHDNDRCNNNNGDYDSVGQLLHDYGEISVVVLRRVLECNRIAQRGLEVDVAELQSRVKALRCENRKIDVLQSQNRRLTKELLEVKMALLARRRGETSRGDRTSRTNTHRNHNHNHNR